MVKRCFWIFAFCMVATVLNGVVTLLLITGVLFEQNIPTGLIMALATAIFGLGIKDILLTLPRGYAHLFVGGLFNLFVGGYELLRSISQWVGELLEEGEGVFDWEPLYLIVILIGLGAALVGRRFLKNPPKGRPSDGAS